MKNIFLAALAAGTCAAALLLFVPNAVLAAGYDCSDSRVPASVTHTLSMGGSNDAFEVVALQCKLNSAISASLTTDGDYGQLTADAVKKYEQTNGLSVDSGNGIAGSQVLSHLGLGGPAPSGGSASGGDFNTCTQTRGGMAFCCEQGGFACSSDCDSYFTNNPNVKRNCSAGSGSGSCGSGMSSVNGVCVPNPPFTAGSGSIASAKSVQDVVLIVLKILLTLSGVTAVLWLVVQGFQYMTAGGNEEQAEKARKGIMNAVIGLVMVVLSYTIVTMVTKFIINGP